jgi:ABC-type transport system involved in cytochrome c biogenesis permease subunit
MSHPTSSTLDRVARVRRPLGGLLALLVIVWAWFVVSAPIDATQGVIQKILYVHPPLAYGAYLGFVLTAIGGALYLWKQRAIYDQLAVAGAEVGVVFCTLMMVTGPIWAKGTWGHWWTWDPRLTLTLLLWFVYVAYLLLRSFTEGSERTARFAAIYGVAGTALIPLNYFVIEISAGGRCTRRISSAAASAPGWGCRSCSRTSRVPRVRVAVALRWEVEARRARALERAA